MPKKGKEYFASAANDLRSHYQLYDGADIHTCLKSLNKAFEQWRYLYEYDEIGTEFQSIRYTMHTSYEAGLEIVPKNHNNTLNHRYSLKTRGLHWAALPPLRLTLMSPNFPPLKINIKRL